MTIIIMKNKEDIDVSIFFREERAKATRLKKKSCNIGINGSFANNPSQVISAFPAVKKSLPPELTRTVTAAASNVSPTIIIPTGSSTYYSSLLLSSAIATKSSSIIPPFLTVNSSISSSTPNSNTTATAASNRQGSGGLSAGAIAGIIIGSLIIIASMTFLIIGKSSSNKNNRPTSFRRGVGDKQLFTSTEFIQTPPLSVNNSNLLHAITTTEPLVTAPAPTGTFRVVSSFMQTLEDELYIEIGDEIQIMTKYDDGWCLGVNLTRESVKGVFPVHCCSGV
jgi:hypothetical protein